MTTTIYLDPEKTGRYEPTKADAFGFFQISSYDVPEAIRVSGTSGAIRGLTFEYSDKEPGNYRVAIPVGDDLKFVARLATHSKKILELNFSRPVTNTELSTIAYRIGDLARPDGSLGSVRLSVTFNCQMIAAILEHWSDIVSPNE